MGLPKDNPLGLDGLGFTGLLRPKRNITSFKPMLTTTNYSKEN